MKKKSNRILYYIYATKTTTFEAAGLRFLIRNYSLHIIVVHNAVQPTTIFAEVLFVCSLVGWHACLTVSSLWDSGYDRKTQFPNERIQRRMDLVDSKITDMFEASICYFNNCCVPYIQASLYLTCTIERWTPWMLSKFSVVNCMKLFLVYVDYYFHWNSTNVKMLTHRVDSSKNAHKGKTNYMWHIIGISTPPNIFIECHNLFLRIRECINHISSCATFVRTQLIYVWTEHTNSLNIYQILHGMSECINKSPLCDYVTCTIIFVPIEAVGFELLCVCVDHDDVPTLIPFISIQILYEHMNKIHILQYEKKININMRIQQKQIMHFPHNVLIQQSKPQ